MSKMVSMTHEQDMTQDQDDAHDQDQMSNGYMANLAC